MIKKDIYKLMLSVTGRAAELTLFKTLRNAEKASINEIEQAKDQFLSQLLRHAYSQVPYYQQAIGEMGGLQFLERTDPAIALNKLPLLTKGSIRDHWEDMKSRDLKDRKWYYNTSGGSTGEPVKLIQDWDSFLRAQAVKMLFDSWTGYSFGMPKVALWGSERDLLVGRETIKTRAGRYFRNEYWLNSFRMTEMDMLDYVKSINNVKPVQILAYVESIYELSRS